MSFYNLPNPYNPGYAIPEYVMAEPPERGTFTTAWLPRGTISTVVPDFLVKQQGKRLLGRNNADLGSLACSSLSGSTLRGSSLGDDAANAAAVTASTSAADAPIVAIPPAPKVVAMPPWQKLAIIGGVGLAAAMLFGKKKGRR